MGSITVYRGGAANVALSNASGELYIKGRESLDGSIRLHLDETETFLHLAYRTSGIWNDIDMVFDELVLDNNLSITFSNNLDFVIHNRPQ